MDDLARAKIPLVQVSQTAPVASLGGVSDCVAQRQAGRRQNAEQQLDGAALQFRQLVGAVHR